MLNLYQLAINILGLGFGFLHRWHVSTLFENDRHFSHLSEMEREMTFQTEMGMYYSYYKTIAESDTFLEGWTKITHDNISQHGTVINAPAKYSLLPEITAGFLYHVAKNLNLLTIRECWDVKRGDELPPVTSCVGLGVPIYFYLEFAWISAMFTGAILFYYSSYLSNSILGGIITILLFFYNHNECTRVQWTPPLRESFAYPLLLGQMYRVAIILRKCSQGTPAPLGLLVETFICTALSLCSWQFSQFVLMTQIIALIILKWMKIISQELFFLILLLHFWALVITTFLAGQNISPTPYMCLLTVSSFFAAFHRVLSRYMMDWLLHIHEVFITIFVVEESRSSMGCEDVSHVFNILRSKLSSYKDFHTMLYTCSPEFDFLPYATYYVIIRTLLLPTAILSGMLVLYYWYRSFRQHGYPQCVEVEVAYTALQTGAFIIMAVFIMRLKLFMNPHLCIIAGLVCAKRYLEKYFGIRNELTRGAIIVLLIAGMSHYGYEKLQEERAIIGEYSNIQQEELFEWIKENTPENAAFAGKMSLMANLMLSTKRPVVNNPYYESKEMRDRTMKVYEIFSRKDAASVYVTLVGLQADYVVLEKYLCLGFANLPPGCQLVELWDMMDNGTAKAAGKSPLCPLLFQGNPYPFRRVFTNNHYVVLQLAYSYFVEYKPENPTSLHYQSR